MAATKEPNIQSTERDLKQNVIAARNEFALYFQLLLFNVPYFNSSWTEMSFIDMMTNSLLEIWNLAWTKRQKWGKPPRRIRHLRCTWLGTTMFAFFLFLRPRFLPRFRPRHLSFRWIHNVSLRGLYIKKFADSNGLNNAKQHDVN